MWFKLLEAQFASARITKDESKFNITIANLGESYIEQVEDVVINPPATGQYECLKSELIKRLAESDSTRVRKLLEGEELGDRTPPSQFLRHLRALAGTCVSEPLLRTLWLGRLPNNVQAILATQQGTPLEKVAELADAIMDTMPGRPSVAETTHLGTATLSTPSDLLADRMMQMLITMLAVGGDEGSNRGTALLPSRPASPKSAAKTQHH
ncbi:hypothetical protein ANTPLA_LOCUS672 [Anthophora plagiata]